MINHILLPADLSDPPKNLIRNAANLSKRHNAALSLLHVFNLPQPATTNNTTADTVPVQPYDHYLDSELMEEEKKVIDDQAKKMYQHIPELNNIKTEIVTSLGLIVEQITDYADKHDVDLIMMETSGASGFKEIFVGTHSEETTRKAICPVLIFPDDFGTFSPQNICVAVSNDTEDFSGKLVTLRDIATGYGSNIHVVHIEDKPEKVTQNELLERAVGNVFPDRDFTFTIIKNENVEEGINNYLKTHRTDLLVLLYHKQNLFSRLLKKSITTNFAYHADMPLLVLK